MHLFTTFLDLSNRVPVSGKLNTENFTISWNICSDCNMLGRCTAVRLMMSQCMTSHSMTSQQQQQRRDFSMTCPVEHTPGMKKSKGGGKTTQMDDRKLKQLKEKQKVLTYL